ncbi:MAG: formylglycine-generating enzyme family protein [Methylocystaceae bacterium]|nr:formylglycine-generating enzyme family protein [Methylocystaceae bacterium]
MRKLTLTAAILLTIAAPVSAQGIGSCPIDKVLELGKMGFDKAEIYNMCYSDETKGGEPSHSPGQTFDPNDAALWAVAQSGGPKDVNSYLKTFPKGQYVLEAQSKLSELLARDWQHVKGSKNLREISAFIENYENGPLVNQAKEQKGLQIKRALEPVMLSIAPGTFDMGDKDFSTAQPVHKVSIGYTFDVGMDEVTLAEWDACYFDGGCSYLPPIEGGYSGYPVSGISWNDAQEYVAWLSKKTKQTYRLPTEAEWEYVARAGTKTRWSHGNNENGLSSFAWFERMGRDGLRPASQKHPNPWGLHDIHGNVSEWVQDCVTDNYEEAPRDGRADETGNCARRILRGGGYNDEARALRTAFRRRQDQTSRASPSGFRLVRSQ